jgi:hypothetical protein
MLGPTTPIPNLEGLSQAQRIDAMVEWFGQNFEDPSEHTPRDDGEFVYVWGGPHDARDELNDAFAGSANEDEIEEAIYRLEGEAMDWAPSESRLVEEDADDEDLVVWEETTIPPEAREKAEAVRRGLNELENIVKEWRRERPQIGHNRPPSPIDDELPDELFDDIETGIAETRVELDKPVPNTATLHANESRFRRIQATIKDWLKSAALGGLALVGGYVGEKFLDRAWEQLGTVSEAISALVAVLPGF